eukprot:gene589-1249_t
MSGICQRGELDGKWTEEERVGETRAHLPPLLQRGSSQRRVSEGRRTGRGRDGEKPPLSRNGERLRGVLKAGRVRGVLKRRRSGRKESGGR